MGVDATLCKDIVQSCKALLCYSNTLVLCHGGREVDVIYAVGKNTPAPKCVPDTPNEFPICTYYCFNSKFYGLEAFDFLS